MLADDDTPTLSTYQSKVKKNPGKISNRDLVFFTERWQGKYKVEVLDFPLTKTKRPSLVSCVLYRFSLKLARGHYEKVAALELIRARVISATNTSQI